MRKTPFVGLCTLGICLALLLMGCPPPPGPVCGDGVCSALETAINCPADCACGNGICEMNESAATCPADCAVGPVCGNGTCEAGETGTNCPADCGAGCGDATCTPPEDCGSCPADCGVCGPVCGNGTCEAGENSTNCPADCGAGCGDGTCTAPEDCTSCQADCGMCGSNCGNGTIDAGEDCDGASLGGSDCLTGPSAPHNPLQNGTLGCYPPGTITSDGVDISCRYDFTGCIGPDWAVYANGLLAGSYVQTNATASSCEVSLGCAGGTSGRTLLHFAFVSQNLGTAAFDLGSPTSLNPPYTGLWAPNGCAGNEFADYSRFWIESATGAVVATGLKGSFCMIENFGSAPDYPGPACSPSHSCGNMGMNVGCADDYYIGLTCQFVDITGVASGSYTLCGEIDYNNQVAELDDYNNIGCVNITIL